MTARMGRALCFALVCATSMCAAADELFEDHHAHEHGVATLDVAIDGSKLLLQFRSPAVNLVGFEHPPRTAQDHASVTRATQLLRDPTVQFRPSADARCRITKADVTAPDWEHAAEHSEFAAEYAFSCERPAALQQLEVRLLKSLGTEIKLKAQVASPDGQRSAELTPSNVLLMLRTQRR